MDWTITGKDTISKIEIYFNDNGEKLISRLSKIIDMFEVQKTKRTEEDFKMEFTPIIIDVSKAIGVEFNASYEKYVQSGRIDCFYQGIDLEYKVPGAIEAQNMYPSRKSSNIDYIDEVHRQIEGYANKEKVNKERILGIIFDGKYVIYTYYLTSDWYVSSPHRINASSLEIFFKKLFSSNIKGRAVTVSNLVEDFGYTSELSKKIIHSFYYKLLYVKNEKVNLLFSQWRALFKEVSGYNSDTLKLDINEITTAYSIEDDDIKIDYLIFSIHTYYAMLIKFLVTQLLNQTRMKIKINYQVNFDTSENTYSEISQIESGQLFRSLGINNFIEDDFFSWYLDVWDDEIYGLVKLFFRKTAEYNFAETINLDDNGSQDLLRKLYNYLMPKSLRHALGEYYSPDWLAQQTYINAEINGNIDASILDPTCGSGTFINIAIKNAIECNKDLEPEKLLEAILNNIHGFDLNPLAVITARANYLLALGDLLNCTNEQIEIPIYHCDAMLTILEQNVQNHKVKKIATRAGVFEIPLELCKDKKCLYSALDYMKDEARISNVLDIDAMLDFLKIKDRDSELIELICTLYEQIYELKTKNILEVWIQVLKNAFIPLFHKKVDYIIGNPPWINWQTLPEDYRESIHKYWYDYKIFDFKGLKARLGNAHDDISVLLTYVVMDNFLKEKGKIAFIINQNLLQAYGGGEGFRKFMIKEDIPVKVLRVDDYVEVEPFLSSGASNKTAVIIMKKGENTEYPVVYNKWSKNDRGVIDSEDSLESVLTKIDFISLRACPVNSEVNNSAWMIGSDEEINIFKSMYGKSDYEARKGVDTSANGIFWVQKINEVRGQYIIRNTPENSKKKIPQFEGPIEPKYLYPLVRGKDLKKWKYNTPYYVVIPYEESMKKTISRDTLRKNSPNLYKYFYDEKFNKHSKDFLNILTTRGTYLKHYANQNVPEYVLYNIGEYTSAPYKVIWKALTAKGMEACVVGKLDGKIIVPDHNNVMIPFENKSEAYYVCAIINSKIVGKFIDSYIAWFKSNHILDNINIPPYDPQNSLHIKLVELSKLAHENAQNDNSNEEVENAIEKIVGKMLLSI
ncbi:MAG: hypothetical protein J6B50_04450 [Lachnospiraceae bacterium]|nr:hypothetical protein [Lachnospiraceae bacterium]